jgi:hypothetical protein
MKERGLRSLVSSLLTPPTRRFMVAGLAFGGFAVLPWALVAQVATAPTASEDPAVIDQAWQKASAKYDAQRAAILEEVDRGGHHGPFRPDWESLENYEVPQWYKDAKFGIFIHGGVYSVPAFGSEWYPRNMYREGSEEYKHHIATYGPQDQPGNSNVQSVSLLLEAEIAVRAEQDDRGNLLIAQLSSERVDGRLASGWPAKLDRVQRTDPGTYAYAFRILFAGTRAEGDGK